MWSFAWGTQHPLTATPPSAVTLYNNKKLFGQISRRNDNNSQKNRFLDEKNVFENYVHAEFVHGGVVLGVAVHFPVVGVVEFSVNLF